MAYRGDNFSVGDVIAGHVHAMFSNSPVALPHIASGPVRGLAVTSERRSAAAPDLPTMIEAGVPDFKAVVWQGFSVPAATPRPIVDRLNAAARAALQAPAEVAGRFKELGAELVGSTPEEFAALVSRELDIWTDVVRQSARKANWRVSSAAPSASIVMLMIAGLAFFQCRRWLPSMRLRARLVSRPLAISRRPWWRLPHRRCPLMLTP